MPTSSVSWLDFSEAERRKMVEIVSLYKERDTRDELGIATIRDSFADLFFPGTSTTIIPHTSIIGESHYILRVLLSSIHSPW